MIPSASQKTVAITFPADETVFALFGALSPGATHCFDSCFVSGVRWIQVPFTVTNRLQKYYTLRLSIVKHRSEGWRSTIGLHLFIFIFSCRILFSYFRHLHSAIFYDDAMDFFNHFWRGRFNWTSWTRFIFRWRPATFEFINLKVNGFQHWYSVPVNFIQLSFDLRSHPLL